MNKHIESIKKRIAENDTPNSELWIGWVWENTDPRFIIPKIQNVLRDDFSTYVKMIGMGDREEIEEYDGESRTYYIIGFKVSDEINFFPTDDIWNRMGINPMWDNPAYASSKEELINNYK